MAYWFNLFLFVALSCALLVVALRPAWQEWQHPTDTQALAVAPNYSNEIDHFADAFRKIALARMAGEPLAESLPFDLVPPRIADMQWERVQRPLMSFNPIHTHSSIHCPQALFISGDLRAGADNRFTGLFVEGAMRLGANSEISQWAHSDDVMHLEAGCTALRRISSTTGVEMDKECCFERVHAPVVRMGVSTTPPPQRIDMGRMPAKFSDINGAVAQTSNLTMIRGDCSLPPGRLYHGSLIVTGRLHIGHGTEIVGDVKARNGVVVGPQVRIEGALVSEHQIQILEEATILGPVISETVILISAHCRLGLPSSPTTVSAENILAEAGSIAYGTVWARDLGVVWST
jgi:hypothetical protein